jgi:hypothetical protein
MFRISPYAALGVMNGAVGRYEPAVNVRKAPKGALSRRHSIRVLLPFSFFFKKAGATDFPGNGAERLIGHPEKVYTHSFQVLSTFLIEDILDDLPPKIEFITRIVAMNYAVYYFRESPVRLKTIGLVSCY